MKLAADKKPNMKKLDVFPLPLITGKSSLHDISQSLNVAERHAIACSPWHGHSLHPQVSFSIGYSPDAILLKYYVDEETIRISYHTDNAPVHEDSCVEFFIAFDDDGYYNLEFNCLGHCYFSYGQSRSDRQLIDEGTIEQIRHMSWIRQLADEEAVHWELVLMIPKEIFVFHDIPAFQQNNCKVNFFKCGDKLPAPHFLSWSPIDAAEPDFHLPQFFGEMQFRHDT